MKKFTSKVLATLLLVSSLNTSVASADFSDLSTIHPNYDAIIKLQELGILEGYSDGTFKPQNSVNRAEFLKIILEGSDIPLNVATETPFSDVDHDQWYAPYIKKAYAEGWLVGYSDGTARPSQTINKVEALKILGEVQGWEFEAVTEKPFDDTPQFEWYAKYVFHAKNNGYLEETGNTFGPSELMTRAGISEIIYRTIEDAEEETTEEEVIEEIEETEEVEENENEEESEEVVEEETVVEETSSIPSTKITKSFFDDIVLDEDFPETFFEDEIYIFEGEITSGNYDTVTALLEDNEQILFDGEVNGDEFSVAIKFEESGDYLLGMFPGSSGTSKALDIKVLDQSPDLLGSTEPEIEDVFFENGRTQVEFTAAGNNFKKFQFTQSGKEVKYLNRQNISSIPIFYRDFENFEEGNVTLKLTTGGGSDSTSFNAVEHHFSRIESENINATIPETISSVSQINFSGKTKVQTQQQAYVINTDGLVDSFDLTTSASTSSYYSSQIIPTGSSFTFDYDVDQAGAYIIEINEINSTAIVNHPIYVGDVVPLIPDYFDLNERKIFSGNVNLNSMRQEMLNEINQAREEHGLDSIVLSDELNDLGQEHSQDMKDNDYFSHINLEGESPDDRRIAAGITTAVGENLALDVSIKFAHEGLMRSAGHRDNILDPAWERVGIGVVNDNGTLIVSQQFSVNPITEDDLLGFKAELITEINELREDANEDSLTYSPDLEDASIYINDKVVDENETLDQELFAEALNEFNIFGSSQGLSRVFTIWDSILESILENDKDVLESSDWESLGVDLRLDDLGNIHTIILLNN